MRIETLPLILGVLVALLGIGIIFDAWTPDTSSFSQERRRRPRIERHRNGEALIGLGMLALAAAFIGRDSWRYSVLVVIIGALFLLVGAILNAGYMRELFVNRGPLRRREANAYEEPAKVPDVEARREESAILADRPVPQSVSREWGGVERRSTPREGEKRKPPRRGRLPEDPAAGR